MGTCRGYCSPSSVSSYVYNDTPGSHRLNDPTAKPFRVRMPPPRENDGVFRSEQGFFLVNPSIDETPMVTLTNVGTVALWAISPERFLIRQAWKLQVKGGGYVFYCASSAGAHTHISGWLGYDSSIDRLIVTDVEDDAVVWSISPSPDASLVGRCCPLPAK
jgi:hypothetical protein